MRDAWVNFGKCVFCASANLFHIFESTHFFSLFGFIITLKHSIRFFINWSWWYSLLCLCLSVCPFSLNIYIYIYIYNYNNLSPFCQTLSTVVSLRFCLPIYILIYIHTHTTHTHTYIYIYIYIYASSIVGIVVGKRHDKRCPSRRWGYLHFTLH